MPAYLITHTEQPSNPEPWAGAAGPRANSLAQGGCIWCSTTLRGFPGSINAGVTHVLNVTCKAYTRREKYFKYLNLEIYDETQEDARKYFRITNRFIDT